MAHAAYSVVCVRQHRSRQASVLGGSPTHAPPRTCRAWDAARVKRWTAVFFLPLILMAPSASVAAPEKRPDYRATVSRIDGEIRKLMVGKSWRRGCPVGLEKLRVVGLRYWGFDRKAHWGRLVVHRGYAWKVAHVFRTLYQERYPVRRIRLVDHYDADDLRSMKDDNTSAFNCRWRAGQSGVWSMHAYGKALDLNPLENPYVRGDYVSPPEGRKYTDRSRDDKGMIHPDDVAVRAFAEIGWEWAGAWTGNVKDYQHFSANNQ